jgi:hypothetical protein
MRALWLLASKSFLFAFVFVSTIACLSPDLASAQIECSGTSVHKYQGNVCSITLMRESPGSPLPVQVPPGTTVQVIVQNQRPNEVITFIATTTSVVPPDILGDIAKQLVSPLSSVSVFSPAPAPGPKVQPPPPTPDPIYTEQAEVKVLLETTATRIAAVNTDISCLEAYTAYDSANNKCLSSPLTKFDTARTEAMSAISAIAADPLPIVQLAKVDDELKDRLKTCPTALEAIASDDDRSKARNCNLLQGNQNTLNNSLSNIQTALSALSQIDKILKGLGKPSETPPFKVVNAANKSTSLVVSAQEQIGKTSSAVATVIITWQSSPWELSTGVALTSLANQTIANSPNFDNAGVLMTDTNGGTTHVTVTPSYPSVVFPLFLTSFRVHTFQANSGNWSFLVSAGIGVNLSTKTADIVAGPSFQYRSVLFTPIFHYGREAELIDGVKVNDHLGPSPPDPPTANQWRPAVGLAISYVIPL